MERHSDDFSVGDIVQVRDWREMGKEFSEVFDPVIDRQASFIVDGVSFIPEMQRFSGRKFRIANMSGSIGHRRFSLQTLDGRHIGWTFSAGMFEPDDAVFVSFDETTWFDMLAVV